MTVSFDELRARLERERDRLRHELDQLRGENTNSGEMTGAETSGYGNHMADDATETFELEKNLTLENNFRQHLNEVEHALHKFEEGTYGLCDVCGRPISLERLEALPHANLDIECKSRQESDRNARVHK